MFVCLCTNRQSLFVCVYMCICAQPIIHLEIIYAPAKWPREISLVRLASDHATDVKSMLHEPKDSLIWVVRAYLLGKATSPHRRTLPLTTEHFMRQ